MKDDKTKCQQVIKIIEEHYKDNTELDYAQYCLFWERVLKKVNKK